MMQTRQALIATALVIFLADKANAAEVDKHLPDSTKIVVSFRVRAAQETPLIKERLLQELRGIFDAEKDLKGMFDNLNFDPFKDIEKVVACSTSLDMNILPVRGVNADATFRDVEDQILGRPRAKETETSEDLAILYGKYDRERFLKQAKEAARDELIKLHKSGEAEFVETAFNESWTAFFSMPDANTLLVASNRDAMMNALAKHAGKKTPRISKSLQELITKADADAHIWFAVEGSGNLIPGLLSLPYFFGPSPRNLPDAVVSVVGKLTFGDDVGIDLQVLAKDDAAALMLRRVLSQSVNILSGLCALGDANLQYPELGVFSELFKATRVTQSGKMVQVRGTVPAGEVKALLKN